MISDHDHIIITGLLSGNERQKNKALEQLYDSCFKLVRAFVLKNSGTEDDAKDIFQDSIAILYRNIIQNKFRKTASLNTYTYAIGKNLWLMKLRKTNKINEVNLNDAIEIGDLKTDYENLDLIENIVNKLGGDCQKILTGFYFESKSMTELQKLFGLGSIQATKNKKLRCMKNLLKLIEQKKLTFEDFLE